MEKWPKLPESIQPFDYESDYDYDGYPGSNAKSIVKLCSVPWEQDYRNVVDWASEKARNEYFQKLEGHEWTIETEWNFKSLEVYKPGLGKHVGALRVDLPYEAALNFNFAYVEMFEQPVPGMHNGRREHYFYFLDSLNKLAPSTTELYLELDTWTTYRNSVSFPKMNLIRGHYPLSLVSADEYLENPLDNSYALTYPEPDIELIKNTVSHEHLVSFQKNEPRVCIATTVDFTQESSIWVKAEDGNFVQPGEAQVPNENWVSRPVTTSSSSLGVGGQSAVTAVGAQQSDGGVLRLYSMAVTDFATFVTRLRKRFPQLLKSLKAAYILDSALIDESGEFTAFRTQLKQVLKQSSPKMLEKFALSKDLFGYDPKYADFAKLYTSQFALIEISNLNGHKVEVSLEDISGDLEIYSRSYAAFPWLKLEAFINGIGGSTKTSYAVKPWNTVNASLFQSSWEDFKFDIDIPTFGIFAEAREVDGVIARMERFKALKTAKLVEAIGKLEAEKTKANSLAVINLENSNAKLELGLRQVVGYRLANLNYNNSLRSSNTELTNTNAAIAAELTNTTRSVDGAAFASRTSYENERANDVLSINAEYGENGTGVDPWTIGTPQGDTTFLTKIPTYQHPDDAGESFLSSYITSFNNVALDGELEGGQWHWNLSTVEQMGIDSEWINEASNNMRNFQQGAVISQFSNRAMIVKLSDMANNEIAISAAQGVASIGAGVVSAVAGGPIGLAAGAGFMGSGVASVIAAAKTGVVRDINAYHMSINSNLLNPIGIQDMAVGFIGQAPEYGYIGPSVNQLEYETNWVRGFNASRFRRAIAVHRNRTLYHRAAFTSLNNLEAATNITNSNQTIGLQNANNSAFGAAYPNAGRSYDTSRANATDAYNTEVSNLVSDKNTADATIEARRSTGVDITNREYDTSVSRIKQEYDAAYADLAAEYSKVAFSEPFRAGENTGFAWLDAWGQRGIDIRIRRISKGTERTAGNRFYEFGYFTPEILVVDTDLSLMTHFTYWQAKDVWVVGDKINETNKAIIRTALNRGIKVWSSPEKVYGVDITTNTRRV